MLKICDNINKIIKKKGLNKKEFAQKLIDLKPTVSRIGETPSLSTIYGYLNGRINIPIELISYVAEVLDITEQELFDTTSKTRKKCFKYFIENADKSELEYFNEFINYKIKNNININYGKVIINNDNLDEKVKKLIDMLEFAPSNFLDKVNNKLEDYKKLSTDF